MYSFAVHKACPPNMEGLSPGRTVAVDRCGANHISTERAQHWYVAQESAVRMRRSLGRQRSPFTNAQVIVCVGHQFLRVGMIVAAVYQEVLPSCPLVSTVALHYGHPNSPFRQFS